MSLLTLWKANPIELEAKQISQLVALAGEGTLRDGNTTSQELREFLSAVPTLLLAKFLDQCLISSFEDSGLALQDVVNELGTRLGCVITPGLYRGKPNAIGFDGIWRFPDGYCVVAETKTTDAYSVSLEKIAAYRVGLIKAGQISEKSSILIIVGRKDTESLEAQVRGSRHAWDIRLISADKLLQLVQIKEDADSKATIQKIRTVLTPLELTRVDFIVDLLATTAEDIKESVDDQSIDQQDSTTAKPLKRLAPVAFQNEVVGRVAAFLKIELKKETRSLYVSVDGDVSVRAVASKAHQSGPVTYYWYAFHPEYREPLEEYSRSYIAFGCGGPGKILLFELHEFAQLLSNMNTTELEDRTYWHVHFAEEKSGKMEIRFKSGIQALDVSKHLLKKS